MYELNRIRLVNVGPPLARYDDVTIDLSGAGSALPNQSLFGDIEQRRPAPASVLLMENGGGKGVLIKLVFSVLLPGRRNTVAGADLDEFLLGKDPGHVVLEWMHAQTGDLLLTGKISQPSNSSDRKTDHAWYTLRPQQTPLPGRPPGLTLQTLPFFLDGRRVRLPGYRDALHEANRTNAAHDLTWQDRQHAWQEALRAHDIDPTLFDIQRRMNVDEGQAAKAFTFTSTPEFIDWVLSNLIDLPSLEPLAENYSSHAKTLTDRARWLLERDFLDAAIPEVTNLVDHHTRHRAATNHRATAQQAAAALAATVHATRTAHHTTTNTHQHALDNARTELATTTNTHQHALDRARELTRLSAQLTLEDHQNHATQVHTQLDHERRTLAAWGTVSDVATQIKAHAEHTRATRAREDANRELTPLRDARDRAASALLTHLEHLIQASETAADQHQRDREDAQIRESKANTQVREHSQREGILRERIRVATQTINEAEHRLEAAIASGTIPQGTTLTQVSALAKEADREQEHAQTAENDAQDHAEQATDALAAAVQAVTAAEREHDAAQATQQKTRDEVARIEDEAEALASLEPIQQTLGVDGDDPVHAVDALDDSTERVLTVLTDTCSDLQARLARLHQEKKPIDDLLQAIGHDELLPAPHHVRTITQRLAHAGITAWSGWSYLAEAIPAHQRHQAIATCPELVDGVVLNDATDLDRARQILAAPPTFPSAAITVGATAALVDAAAGSHSAPTDRFTIDPNPGLYDPAKAREERTRLERVRADLGAQISTVDAELTQAREALAGLQQWRRRYPAGSLTAARDTRDRATQALTATTQALTQAHQAHDTAQTTQTNAHTHLSTARDAHAHAREHALTLHDLERTTRNALQATATLPDLNAEAESHLEAARRADNDAQHARRQAQRSMELARQEKSNAASYREDAAQVVYTHRISVNLPQNASRAQLQAAATTAQRDLEQHGTGQDLDAALADAERALKAAEVRLSQVDPAQVQRARDLLDQVGGDAHLWQDRTDDARERVTVLDLEATEAQQRVGEARSALVEASPEPGSGKGHWAVLEPEWTPRDVVAARDLAERAHGLERGLARQVADCVDHVDELKAVGSRLAQRARQLDDASGLLRSVVHGVLSADSGAVPAGEPASLLADDDDPVAAAGTALGDLRTAEAAERAAAKDVDAAAARVRAAASHPRFADLKTPMQNVLTSSATEVLTAKAEEWSRTLEARRASLTVDIEKADAFRDLLVDLLVDQVSVALDLLTKVHRRSTLPDQLDTLGGKHFLKITFQTSDPATRRAHVATLIDSASQADTRTGHTRDGLDLVQSAVHAATPRGFTVKVLHPTKNHHAEYSDITDIDKFSGGQGLTAAILMYATLAAVHASLRGTSRASHAGLLFLDNSLGTASADYLLKLQLLTAQALGLQIVVASGLQEERVLAHYPLWVRLANTPDRRTGHSHAHVTGREAHPTTTDDERGLARVTAPARVYRKHTP